MTRAPDRSSSTLPGRVRTSTVYPPVSPGEEDVVAQRLADKRFAPDPAPAPKAMKAAAKPAPSMKMAAPAAASGSAKCKDGQTVTYKSRSGTCRGHGGVATWL